jgi:hypothetical protein
MVADRFCSFMSVRAIINQDLGDLWDIVFLCHVIRIKSHSICCVDDHVFQLDYFFYVVSAKKKNLNGSKEYYQMYAYSTFRIWRTLRVGRRMGRPKIGCSPRRTIMIRHPKSTAVRDLHFTPCFLKLNPRSYSSPS